MNIALIFAGGTGQRMNTKTKPKQFLELHGKPILVYTIEHFQKHEAIDGIILVCVESWIDYAEELIQRYGLTKIAAVVPGGETGQMSIYNGLCEAVRHYPRDALVLIHDGVRPLIDAKTISDAISCARKHGSAVTVSPAVETVTMESEEGKIGEIIDRSHCLMAKAPQCFFLGDILDMQERAIVEGRTDFIDSASLMAYYGHSLYTVEGQRTNIKVTTPLDFYIFRAVMDANENSQIFGF